MTPDNNTDGQPPVPSPAGPTPPEETPPTPPPTPEDDERTRKKAHRRQILKGFLSFVGFVASVVVLATLINMFIFQSYYVDGTSMTPTLQPNDRLIINKIPRTLAKIAHAHFIPKRGEVIVFNSSLVGPDGQREQLIKRVIGLPGDRVVVKNDHVTIYNHDNPKGFDPEKTLNLHLAPTSGEVDTTVPANEVFVFGDNRTPGGSYDSRELGPIPTDNLVGELVMRIVPVNHAKFF